MKNHKLKSAAVVTVMTLLIGGCSMPGNKEEAIVINEDVKSDSALADGRLLVESKPDVEVFERIVQEPSDQPVTDETITYNKDGALYSMDLSEKTTEEVAVREAFAVSENGKWALSFENEEGELYAHNLENGEMKKLEDASPDDTQFLDNDVFYRYFKTQTIARVNLETDERDTWDMGEFENYSLAYMAKDQDRLYITAESEKEGYGVYELLEEGAMQLVFGLKGTENEISDFSILPDGSVLFQGTMAEKDGIFLRDHQTGDVTKLLSGGEDQEGKWINFYKLSPDKSKILYDMPVQVGEAYKSDIYVAKLEDGRLVDDTRIMENTELYKAISFSGGWSADSKMIYVKTADTPDEYVGRIAVFEVKE